MKIETVYRKKPVKVEEWMQHKPTDKVWHSVGDKFEILEPLQIAAGGEQLYQLVEKWVHRGDQSQLECNYEKVSVEVKGSTTKDSYDGLKTAMHFDLDFAWGWFCNVAMAFVDEKGDPYLSNRAAARFMKNAFDLDLTNYERYKSTVAAYEERRRISEVNEPCDSKTPQSESQTKECLKDESQNYEHVLLKVGDKYTDTDEYWSSEQNWQMCHKTGFVENRNSVYRRRVIKATVEDLSPAAAIVGAIFKSQVVQELQKKVGDYKVLCVEHERFINVQKETIATQKLNIRNLEWAIEEFEIEIERLKVSLKESEGQYRHLAATLKDGTSSALDKIWSQAKANGSLSEAHSRLKRDSKKELALKHAEIVVLKAELESLKSSAPQVKWVKRKNKIELGTCAVSDSHTVYVTHGEFQCLIPIPKDPTPAQDPAIEAWETYKVYAYYDKRSLFIAGYRAARMKYQENKYPAMSEKEGGK